MTSTSKIILCTGANKGLGLAILEVAGLRLNSSTVFVLCSRNIEAGKAASEQLVKAGVKVNIEVIQLDVTNDKHIVEAVKFVETKYGKLDVLINNAGIFKYIPHSHDPAHRESFNDLLNINFTSTLMVSTAFLPLLHKASHPKVINITSGLASLENTLKGGMPPYIHYGMSKVGMNGVTAHMQRYENEEVKDQGKDGEEGKIRFYAVHPGFLKTALTLFDANAKDPKEGTEGVVRLIMDEKLEYEGGSQWEFEDGEMRTAPW